MHNEHEPIYSDPLDALEKADDTIIYHCPEFSEDVVIYEEPPNLKPAAKPTPSESRVEIVQIADQDKDKFVPRRKRAISTTQGTISV